MNSLRWIKLFTLILLVGVMVAVVAANEQKTPDLTLITPGAIEPAALSIETAPGENSGASSIRFTRSESASVPSKMGLTGLSNASPSFTSQIAGIEGGLTVSVNHSVTVAADGAYVVIIPPVIYAPSGNPQPISSEDTAAVIAKLAEIGIAKEDIEFNFQQYYSTSISAKVQISQLPQVGQLVLDAVESVLGLSQSHGVRFSLSPEACDQALARARRQAVPQADKTAADLAQALGVQRGGVIGAMEYPPGYSGYGLNACGNQQDPYQDPYIVEPFDANPELEVAMSLEVTYTIEPTIKPAVQP